MFIVSVQYVLIILGRVFVRIVSIYVCVVFGEAMPMMPPGPIAKTMCADTELDMDLIGKDDPGPYKPAISKAARFHGVILNIVLYYGMSY